MRLQDFGYDQDLGRSGGAARGLTLPGNRFGPMNDIDNGFAMPKRGPRGHELRPEGPSLRGSPLSQGPRGRRRGIRARGPRNEQMFEPMMPSQGRRHSGEDVEFGEDGELDDFEEEPYGPDPRGRVRGGPPGDV